MSAQTESSHSRRPALEFKGWMPLVLMIVLMIAIGAYTAAKSSAFLTEFNLNGLFVATVPLALLSMGQLNVLLVGSFDVSVGALMTLGVVIASYTMTPDMAWYTLVGGSLVVMAIGFLVGVINAALIKVIGLSAIIATLATLSILQGTALWLRPVPSGNINDGIINALTYSVGAVPLSFIGVVVFALLCDYWLYRRPGGLTMRAVGFDQTSARRLGMRSNYLVIRAFIVCALMAAVASLFLSAQIAIGDPTIGLNATLLSIAAPIVGGATFGGGRGSFIGAVFGALFFYLIVNILPFLGLPTAYSQIITGSLTVLALVVYQGSALWARLKTFVSVSRRSRSVPAEQA